MLHGRSSDTPLGDRYVCSSSAMMRGGRLSCDCTTSACRGLTVMGATRHRAYRLVQNSRQGSVWAIFRGVCHMPDPVAARCPHARAADLFSRECRGPSLRIAPMQSAPAIADACCRARSEAILDDHRSTSRRNALSALPCPSGPDAFNFSNTSWASGNMIWTLTVALGRFCVGADRSV